MDYRAGGEVARLVALSDELAQRSRDVNERGAWASAALRRALARCEAVCAASDRLYGGTARAAESTERAGPESRHGS